MTTILKCTMLFITSLILVIGANSREYKLILNNKNMRIEIFPMNIKRRGTL